MNAGKNAAQVGSMIATRSPWATPATRRLPTTALLEALGLPVEERPT
jgi:hypothetical protein